MDAQRTIFQKITYFGQYRDDCITKWTGDVDKVNLLLELLNTLDENLKSTVEIGGKSLCFLNLKITIDDKKLATSVYSKPSISHLYLDDTLCHPTRSIDGVVTGVTKHLNEYAQMATIEKIFSLLGST